MVFLILSHLHSGRHLHSRYLPSRQGRVKVPETQQPEAALPPDVRKGFAFPRASALTDPLSSAGRLSLPAELRARSKAACAGKPEAFRTSGGRAASRDFDATVVIALPALTGSLGV